MIVAAAGSGLWVVVGALVAVTTLVATAVAALLRVRGETRQAVEKAADKRVEEMRETAEHFRGAYDSARAEAVEQRELKHQAENEAAALRMKTDQSAVIKEIATLRAEMSLHFDGFTTAIEAFRESQSAQTEVLRAIERRLNN